MARVAVAEAGGLQLFLDVQHLQEGREGERDGLDDTNKNECVSCLIIITTTAATSSFCVFPYLREHRVRVPRAPEARHAEGEAAEGAVDALGAGGGEGALGVHFHDKRDEGLGDILVEVGVVLGLFFGGLVCLVFFGGGGRGVGREGGNWLHCSVS